MPNRSNILIVEDDEDIRETMVEALKEEGYDAIGAEDGSEALKILHEMKTFEPSLILLDLMMPRMNGADFRKHQLADPKIAHIPVIILSADANAQTKSIELNARGALRKPVKLSDLLLTIEQFALPLV